MKTVLSIMLLSVVAALFTACGGSDPADDGPDASADPVTCTPSGCAK